ncbi:ArsI/CadI family heavy metal resistance metalloenzyme [Nocardia sp. BMG51109]|uniref:ArsI/CadI family heavy metal resistance metalloenzyme n=1 Tax=Nocardia sp. BMG51109 TaxID=1056816 RepID=UPI0004660A16|nr:ArsI/CadI family heavy metal resistance metalloenzyme [Nocardia sp. BMG51109]
MSRIQLALNVDDLDRAVTFYSTLFAAEPAKRKPGYANFALAEPPLKLVLIENPGQGGSVNHLGVEVDSSERVHGEIARLSEAGLFTEEQIATTCCFATQDKVWVTGADEERWEVYTVLADSESFGTAPELGDAEAVQACCGTPGEAAGDNASGGTRDTADSACCEPAARARAVASGADCCR